MANKKIIELDAVSQVNSDAVFPLSQLVSGDQKTLKATIAQIQSAVLAPVADMVTMGEASGSIASFNTDINDKLFSCYANTTAVQSGSGTPAPDNVRAISGWSACNLSATGKNIWRYGNASGTGSVAIANVHYPAGNYVMSGVWTSSDTDDTDCLVLFQYVDNSYQYVYFSRGSRQSRAFTLTKETKSVNFYAARGYDHSVGDTFTASDIQLEFGTSATAFEPFGTTHNIPFNTTVYGGVLDVLSGRLTVTHERVDLGSLTYSYSSPRFSYIFSSGIKSGDNVSLSNAICDCYIQKTRSEIESYNYAFALTQAGGSTTALNITDSRYTNPTDLKTALNGNYLVYELATPTTIQLTPTEVKTILGQNNIFADTGNIDLKYLETIGNRL